MTNSYSKIYKNIKFDTSIVYIIALLKVLYMLYVDNGLPRVGMPRGCVDR